MDGIPVAMMEAMACEVPVVSTNISGIPELVDEGRTGFLVGPDEYEVGGDRLYDILSNPDLAGRLRDAGLQSVKDNFTADAVVPLYEDEYYRLLDM